MGICHKNICHGNVYRHSCNKNIEMIYQNYQNKYLFELFGTKNIM